jgi:aminopeptidase N
VVVSSGVSLRVIDNADKTRTWQIAGGPLRDMTVIAGPFEAISDDAAGATVTSYYLEGHEVAGRAALAHAAASLRLFNDTYGPYPYTELDVVEAPLGNRGMEYAALILIGTDLYTNQRQYLTFLVAHETAHQWWYGLVGNNPYKHPWLDEGLTEYSAFDYYRSVFGQPAAEQLLANRWQTPFAVAVEDGITGQINRPAAEFDEVSYELLVYGKAALFFNDLRGLLGDDTYRSVIQNYYSQNRYQIATPEMFLRNVEQISGQDLSPLVKEWLE